jgi:alpha-tubulin suppressor-like RCC1 family protein
VHSVVLGKQKKEKNKESDSAQVDQESECVFTFGSNARYVLGRLESKSIVGDQESGVKAVDRLDNEGIVHVSCGHRHTAFLGKKANQEGGTLFMCGNGLNGRLGLLQDFWVDPEAEETKVFTGSLPQQVVFPTNERIAYVSCGADHTLAITVNGICYSWGCGSFGNLGLGTTNDRDSPTQVQMPVDMHGSMASCRMVAAGAKHSLAITPKGQVFAWGHGGNGRLGLGEGHEAALLPVEVTKLSGGHDFAGESHDMAAQSIAGIDFRWIAAGESHSAGLDSHGMLFTWGAGSYGRAGHGEPGDTPVPKRVASLANVHSMAVALGTLHSLALADTGTVYGWGSGSATGVIEPGELRDQATPKKVLDSLMVQDTLHRNKTDTKISSDRIVQIAAGSFHSLALNEKGIVFTWGVASHGRLGHIRAEESITVEEAVPRMIHLSRNENAPLIGRGPRGFEKKIKAVEATEAEGFLLSKQPKNWNNQATRKIPEIACGGMFSAAIVIPTDKPSPDVWTWGCGGPNSALGHGDEEDRWCPTKVAFFGVTFKVKKLAVGLEYCLAVVDTPETQAQLFAWGNNQFGQLGTGDRIKRMKPVNVQGMKSVCTISAGENHSMATTLSGQLYSWGSMEGGKLGHGSTMSKGSIQVPRLLRFPNRVCGDSCGVQHSAIIDSVGSLYTFGVGWFGRLGTGALANQYAPFHIEHFAVDHGHHGIIETVKAVKVVSVHCAAYHTCVIDDNCKLWCCGRDTSVCKDDHLVNFTRFDLNEAGGEEASIISVEATGQHTLVLSRTGSLFMWGDGRYGQLGRNPEEPIDREHQDFSPFNFAKNTFDYPDKPGQTGEHPVKVAAGGAHSIVMTNKGNLYTWGMRTGGRLGHDDDVDPKDGKRREDARDLNSTKLNIVWKPKAVYMSWKDNTLAGHQQSTKEAEEEKPEDQDASEDKRKFFEIPALQRQLKKENENHVEKSLEAMESVLKERLQGAFHHICRLWDKPTSSDANTSNTPCEYFLRNLRNRFDTSVCRNVLLMGLSDRFPNLPANTSPEIAERLVYFEEIVWILQQQPCYLARLVEAILDKNSQEILDYTLRGRRSGPNPIPDCVIPSAFIPKLIRDIYRDLEDDRTRHLFMGLLRRMLHHEIIDRKADHKKRRSLDFIFAPNRSYIYRFLSDSVISVYYRELHDWLVSAKEKNSLISYVLEWTPRSTTKRDSQHGLFSIEWKDLDQFEGRKGKHGTAHQDAVTARENMESLQQKQHDHMKTFQTFMKNAFERFLQNFPFPKNPKDKPPLRCILGIWKVIKKAHELMLEHRDEKAELFSDGEKENLYLPLARLFFGSILGYLLENHEQIMTAEHADDLSRECEKIIIQEKEGEGENFNEGTKNSGKNKKIQKDTKDMVEKVHFNLRNIGVFLRRAVSDEFKPSDMVFRQLGHDLLKGENSLLSGFIKKRMNSVHDDTEANLTIDLYLSHYDIGRERFITLQTHDLLRLSNALWIFQESVTLHKPTKGDKKNISHDRLQQLIEEKVQPPIRADKWFCRFCNGLTQLATDEQCVQCGMSRWACPNPECKQVGEPEWTECKKCGYKKKEAVGADGDAALILKRCWDPAMIAYAETHGMKHNFAVRYRFLRYKRDLCFCRDCYAPIPRNLAHPEQRKRSDLRLVQTYKPNKGPLCGEHYPFFELQTLLRTLASSSFLPLLKEKSLKIEAVKFEFDFYQNKIIEHLKGKKANDREEDFYDLVTKLEGGKRMIEVMKTYNHTAEELSAFMRASFEERKQHFKYLKDIEEGIKEIEKRKGKYNDNLSHVIKTLERIVSMSEGVEVPQELQEKSSEKSVRLKFVQAAKKKKRRDGSKANAMASLSDLNVNPTVTYSLYALRAQGVVNRMGNQIENSEFRSIKFVFNGKEDGSWNVVVVHQDGKTGKTQVLFEFDLSQEDLEKMRHAGKNEKKSFYPPGASHAEKDRQGFVTINCFSLLQLLGRIGATSV